MASIEIFAKNVRRLLAQRNIRIKDLAARIGLSESYLSLVLNGTRKNLSDEYKDRISSVLNVPLNANLSRAWMTRLLSSPIPKGMS